MAAISLLHIVERLRALRGMRRVAAAFAIGAAGALAFPPICLFPVLALCFPALIVLLQGAVSLRAAFLIGWSFAFGYLVAGLYWTAASMFVDIRTFWWAVPLALAVLPALFALYYGVAAALAWRIGLRGTAGALTVALLWFVADYARGHLFTGFPWNLEGYAWNHVLPILQIVSVTGIYGLTLITLAAACLPAALLDGKRHRMALLCAAVALVFIAAWGEGRLNNASDEIVPDVRLRIVQPDVDQARKWLPSERDKNFRELLAYTSATGARPITHIVWPETASAYYLAEDPLHRLAIAGALPRGASLVTGVIRREPDGKGSARFYNSLIAIDDDGHILTGYDKFHLVPFGEYIPLRAYLPRALHAIVPFGDFTPGPGLSTLHVPGLPSFSPLVCYEVIFPGEVADENDRPGFLINVTNDGWYGHTSGPYQHFASARARAIEEGLPLVRAANTGVSGVVDAYGRVSARLGLGKKGFIDADLPAALPPTFFGRYGEGPLWSLFTFITAFVLWNRWRDRGR